MAFPAPKPRRHPGRPPPQEPRSGARWCARAAPFCSQPPGAGRCGRFVSFWKRPFNDIAFKSYRSELTLQNCRSAGFQPAVSATSSRQSVTQADTPAVWHALRIGNPRYGRLEVCATSRSQHDRAAAKSGAPTETDRAPHLRHRFWLRRRNQFDSPAKRAVRWWLYLWSTMLPPAMVCSTEALISSGPAPLS
jgi:hypothetical protein